MRGIVVLGSTGSVGTQALDVISANPDRFRVVGLAAGGPHSAGVAGLLAQVRTHRPEVVAVADPRLAGELAAALDATSAAGVPGPVVLDGSPGVCDVAAWPCDVVLNALPGAAGLRPTLTALGAGRTLALANKESLIVGGPLVRDAAAPGQLVPVDSEHSALAQCLRGGRRGEVRRLVLTASGGPFRGRPRSALESVTPEEALAHPTWRMGPLVTVNSATLVNKGLETIEAHLLFDVGYDDIEVVVHPESLVHSMVEFTDGATLAQLSPPDMRLPIALALGWPERVPGATAPLGFAHRFECTFEPVDHEAFPGVRLAAAAGRAGGTAPGVFNAANEECVAAFLAGGLAFPGIVDTVAAVLAEHAVVARPSLDEVLAWDGWARRRARELVGAAV